MTGLYLYCIREKTDSGFFIKGIDGGDVLALPYKDLEAVVSEVSLEDFGAEEIQKKAQEDLGWIKGKAQVHEQVIEKAMDYHFSPFPLGKSPLENKGLKAAIPMKFGTIFKTREKLRQVLKKHYFQFKENLKNLHKKQEWAVKIYLDRGIFQDWIKKSSSVVQDKEQEIASLPEGTAYFMQKQIDEAVSKESDNALKEYIDIFFEELKKYTHAGTRGKILAKELTEKLWPMVLNAIFLVSEEMLEDFVKKVNKLNKEYKSKGFRFEYSGPWPAYNFI
ncbi:MAG: GvpL/GvpF family gas vesicle protein [bacterium]